MCCFEPWSLQNDFQLTCRKPECDITVIISTCLAVCGCSTLQCELKSGYWGWIVWVLWLQQGLVYGKCRIPTLEHYCWEFVAYWELFFQCSVDTLWSPSLTLLTLSTFQHHTHAGIIGYIYFFIFVFSPFFPCSSTSSCNPFSFLL